MSFATTKVRQKWREVAGLAPGEPVPSPCNSICRIAQGPGTSISRTPQPTGLSEACLRSIDDMAGWSGLDDAGKRVVWERLAARAGVVAVQEKP